MKIFNIIRYFLALTGLVVMITILSGAYILLVANKMKSIVLAEKVLNNLFYHTMGIDVRFEQSTAEIINNILDGKIRTRDGGTFSSSHNLVFKGLANYEKKTSSTSLYRIPRGVLAQYIQ